MVCAQVFCRLDRRRTTTRLHFIVITTWRTARWRCSHSIWLCVTPMTLYHCTGHVSWDALSVILIFALQNMDVRCLWVTRLCNASCSFVTDILHKPLELTPLQWWANHKSDHKYESQILCRKDWNQNLKSKIISQIIKSNQIIFVQIKSQINFTEM